MARLKNRDAQDARLKMRASRAGRAGRIQEARGEEAKPFAARLNEIAQRLGYVAHFNWQRISRIENAQTDLSPDDALVYVAADPKKRPLEWLLFGREASAEQELGEPETPHPQDAAHPQEESVVRVRLANTEAPPQQQRRRKGGQ